MNMADSNNKMESQNFLDLYNSSLMREFRKLLNTELPDETKAIFRQINTIYNNQNSNSPFGFIRNRPQSNSDRYAHKLLFEGVSDGLAGCFYHVRKFLDYEHAIRNQSVNIINALSPTKSLTLGIPNQNLIFEYEAFTYSCRATLDRWNWFLNYYFEQDTKNLYKLEATLKKNFSSNTKAKAINEAISEYREFLDSQISSEKGKTERDRIAHREQINFASINILYQHEDASVQVWLFSPIGENKNASELLLSRLSNLNDFIKTSLQKFFAV